MSHVRIVSRAGRDAVPAATPAAGHPRKARRCADAPVATGYRFRRAGHRLSASDSAVGRGHRPAGPFPALGYLMCDNRLQFDDCDGVCPDNTIAGPGRAPGFPADHGHRRYGAPGAAPGPAGADDTLPEQEG